MMIIEANIYLLIQIVWLVYITAVIGYGVGGGIMAAYTAVLLHPYIKKNNLIIHTIKFGLIGFIISSFRIGLIWPWYLFHNPPRIYNLINFGVPSGLIMHVYANHFLKND